MKLIYRIHTQDDVRLIKLGEVVWLDGKFVQLKEAPCFKCCFFKIRGHNSGQCTMSFSCEKLVGKDTLFHYSFEEVMKGGI